VVLYLSRCRSMWSDGLGSGLYRLMDAFSIGVTELKSAIGNVVRVCILVVVVVSVSIFSLLFVLWCVGVHEAPLV
jgi:hypothetical protein